MAPKRIADLQLAYFEESDKSIVDLHSPKGVAEL